VTASPTAVPAVRPDLDNTANVRFVWGIVGIDRDPDTAKHVINLVKGVPIYDPTFHLTPDAQLAMIQACMELRGEVEVDGFEYVTDFFKKKYLAARLISSFFVLIFLNSIPSMVYADSVDCFMADFKNWIEAVELPRGILDMVELPIFPVRPKSDPRVVDLMVAYYATQVSSDEDIWRKIGFTTIDSNDPDFRIAWVSIGAKTKVNLGIAAFPALAEFNTFERLAQRYSHPAAALGSAYQSSALWVRMSTEIVAVSGAVWGVAMSTVLCLAAIVILTGHLGLSLLMIATICAVIATVVGIFFYAGYELGAVEAISLSIIVGTSADYGSHVVEAFLGAGHVRSVLRERKAFRAERVSVALARIGMPVFSAAVTTAGATALLLFCRIAIFAKFGTITLVLTVVSITYSLIGLPALLNTCGPARYIATGRDSLRAFLAVGVAGLGAFLFMWTLVGFGVTIYGPSGDPLFE
jgi:hypothetical protein